MAIKSFQAKRRALLGLVMMCGALDASALGAVGEALVRPALNARRPDQAVLLGAAKAGTRLVAVGERGLVLLSDDQGKSWRQAPTPVSVTLTAVRFHDAAHGVAVGHGGVVLTSSDGGQRWTPRLDGRKAAALVLDAARASRQESAIEDAERLVADGPDKPFFDVLMLDTKHLMAVGAYGLALESRDGGETWRAWMNRLDNPKGLHYYAMRRHGDTFLIAGEQGMVQLSTDAGRSFRRIETPYKGSFFTAELLNGQELFVAGLRGNVWRSRDGGQNWVKLPAPVAASITASALLPGGKLVLCNQAGMLLAPDGDRLQAIKAAPLPSLNGLLVLDDHSMLALSAQGAVIMDSITVKQASN
ncbi:WD40/YVTN/BNR-like repeat-containing protein [Noviherbaspirillum saxi]|nr:YCF48-related protein [Noviherbaspirillum saxi]